MASLFIAPLPFVVTSGNQSTLGPGSNANLDEPALVYRSNNLTTVFVVLDLGTGKSYDTIAVVGSNLRATDKVQIRTGTSTTGTGGYAGVSLNAYSGTLPDGSTSIAVFKLGAIRTERYIRIDFNATGHPDGFVQAQRVVVGKAITTEGIDTSAEQGFLDQSQINTGPGWTSVDTYQVLTRWKFTMSWLSDAAWRSDWFPFLQSVGKKRAFLFIPDDSRPETYQTDALFGRITTDATGKVTGYDMRSLELTMVGLAQ